jgi:hypothetical protein
VPVAVKGRLLTVPVHCRPSSARVAGGVVTANNTNTAEARTNAARRPTRFKRAIVTLLSQALLKPEHVNVETVLPFDYIHTPPHFV